MGATLLLAALGALGVVAAFAAVAMPKGEAYGPPREPWEAGLSSQAQARSLRDRLNQPFQVLADRSNRQHRLNGGLTIAENLARADLKLRTSEFVMIQVGFLIVYAVLALLRFGFGWQFIVAGVAGYLIPMRYVKWRQRRRLRDLNKRLPDTLSLLSNALKAGLSLPQAIEAVAQNSVPPISDELARVTKETNLGHSVPVALANMVRRVGSEDLDLIVTAISIHASVGGNLARILDTISHTIRQRVQVKAQISALTAQARASGWVITLLPFVVAIILDVITPSYFRAMFTDNVGRILLVLAAFSIFMGNVFVRRITNFRV